MVPHNPGTALGFKHHPTEVFENDVHELKTCSSTNGEDSTKRFSQRKQDLLLIENYNKALYSKCFDTESRDFSAYVNALHVHYGCCYYF